MIDALRFGLFHLGVGLLTLPFTLGVLLAWPLPYGVRESIARGWCHCVLFWLRCTWGVRHRVVGREHLPDAKTPVVVLSNHQSAWETIAYRTLFPAPTSWVIKRSLFRVPVYGWGLRALEEIGIDRRARVSSLRQIEEQGSRHLAAGRWVITFPEGTRAPPGKLGRFASGGARLACAAGAQVLPVAVDSGDFWPVSGWRKNRGRITVRIGPPIDCRDRSPEEVGRLARDWIAGALGIADGQGHGG